ncbi:MAG: CRISPR-associated protein Cas4 [Ruminococcus sp.]|nr:CRISPR-associated protein Cas4 [Ruminococcus sp.]
MTEDSISIRSVQHWLYCRHRWGLMEIDRAWAENYYVTKANLLHKRVHENNRYTSKSKISHTDVTVYNDLPQYGLYGVTDCLEESHGQYTIVEYKPTQPKNELYRHEDLMQVFSQKICVDYVFRCNSAGVLYYADTKRRVKLPLQENYEKYDAELKQILLEMRKNIREGTIPPIVKGQNCSGCSMKDLCMPSCKKHSSLQKSIAELLEGKP